MARELQNINESGELTEIKLDSTSADSVLLKKSEIEAGLDTKEDALSMPTVDGQVLASETDGTKTWVDKVGEAPSDGSEYVRKDDGWTPNTGGTGVTEAPIDGKPYARKDADWEEVSPSFNFIGTFTPSGGAEYPATVGLSGGDTYTIVGVGAGYTFITGTLAGDIAYENAWMVLNSASEWVLTNNFQGAVDTVWGTIAGTLSNQTDLQGALDAKEDDGAAAAVQSNLDTHEADTTNPHTVTKDQVGLDQVTNTSDANKPVSGPQQTALDLKQDKSTAVGDFLDLTDTPSTYAGASEGYRVQVNAGGDGLEFGAPQAEEWREPTNTGLLSGGSVTETTSTTITVTSGTGWYIDSWTTPNEPAKTDVVWAEAAGLVVTMPDTYGMVRVYVESNGTVTVGDTPSSASQRRNTVILAYVNYKNGAITGVLPAPQVVNNELQALQDYMEFMGTNISGFTIKAVTSPAALSIWTDAGDLFASGVNWEVDRQNPNIKSYPAVGSISTPGLFDVIYTSGLVDSVGLATIPKYTETSPGVTLALSGNKACIHYLHRTYDGGLVLQLATTQYDSATDAIKAIASDRGAFPYAEITDKMTLLAQIYVDAGSSDFSDSSSAGIVNQSGGAGGSTGVTGVTEFIDLTDTPSTYVGEAGKTVAVKSDETGLEYLEPASGLPDGGTTGQYLGKESDADQDVSWQSNPAAPIGQYTPQIAAYVVSGSSGAVDQLYNASVAKETIGRYIVTFDEQVTYPYLVVTGAMTTASPSTPLDNHVTIDKVTDTGFRVSLYDGTIQTDSGGWTVMVYSALVIPFYVSSAKLLNRGGYKAIQIRKDGLYCAGESSNGELGHNGDIVNMTKMYDGEVIKIDLSGSYGSSLLTADGKSLRTGDTGQGTYIHSYTTVVSSGAIDISGIGPSLVTLKSDGTVWGIGASSSGQLGVGDFAYYPSAVVQSNASDIVAMKMDISALSTVVVSSTGELFLTGYNNFGSIGTGDIVNVSAFTSILTDVDYTKGLLLSFCVLAVKSNGELWGWGRNGNALGLPGASNVLLPTLTNTDVKKVFTSPMEGLDITGDLQISATDYNDTTYIEKTDGSFWESTSSGWSDTGITNIKQVAGDYALLTNGNLVLLSNGAVQETGVEQLVSYSHIRMLDGRTLAKGINTDGQLGIGNTTTPSVWTETTIPLPPIKSMDPQHDSYRTNVFVTEDNELYVCGFNQRGITGIDSSIDPVMDMTLITS